MFVLSARSGWFELRSALRAVHLPLGPLSPAVLTFPPAAARQHVDGRDYDEDAYQAEEVPQNRAQYEGEPAGDALAQHTSPRALASGLCEPL